MTKANGEEEGVGNDERITGNTHLMRLKLACMMMNDDDYDSNANNDINGDDYYDWSYVPANKVICRDGEVAI